MDRVAFNKHKLDCVQRKICKNKKSLIRQINALVPGEQGPTGPTGPAGVDGDTGPTGSAGVIQGGTQEFSADGSSTVPFNPEYTSTPSITTSIQGTPNGSTVVVSNTTLTQFDLNIFGTGGSTYTVHWISVGEI